MVQIRDIKDIPCKLYGPNDEYIGEIVNNLQFYDILLQIQNESANGYYLIFKNKKIRINCLGTPEEYPKGLFDTYTNILYDLLN